MNFRLTAVLFAVVLTLVVGLLIYALVSPDPTVNTTGPFAALTAAGKKAADVTSVEIARTSPRDEKLVFQKSGEKWRLTHPANASVDSAAVDTLVTRLLALEPQPYSGSTDRAVTGLGKPEVTVTLRAGDETAAVHLGQTNIGDSETAVTFMVSATDPNALPMAVLTSPLRNSLFRADAKSGMPANMVKWRSDFRSRTLLADEIRDAVNDSQSVTLARGDQKLTLTRGGDDWRITTPDLGRADVDGASQPDPARFTGVRPLLNAVLFLQTSGPADVIEDVPAADLPKYGLAPADNPLTVEYAPTGKPSRTLLVGKAMTDEQGQPVVPSRFMVKLADDPAVFAVTTDKVDELLNTLNDPTSLQNRDLIPPSKLAEIDAIDSTYGGGFKLRKLVGGAEVWGVYGGGGEPTEAQLFAVQNLLNKLAAPRAAAEVLAKPDDSAFDQANLQAELKFWAGGVDKTKAAMTAGQVPTEPPVTGEPFVTLRFGRQFLKTVTRPDGTSEERALVVVRRTTGGETADLEVPLDLVALALQPRIKFVNARVPSFVPATATGLVLFRDGTRTEYVKTPNASDPAYPNGVWHTGNATGPLADGDKVLELLTGLATMSPTLLMEKADDLKPLGLDPADPKLSARVTVPADGGGSRTLEFQFGEPLKNDDKSVYFKAVDKPFVYAAAATLFDQLRTADLTDKVAFRLAPAKVKSVRMRGWANSTTDNSQVKLTAEKQGGAWVVTEPQGAEINSATMDAWMTALQAPKTVGPAPVEPGKDLPADYGLGYDGINLLIISAGEKPTDPEIGLDVTLGALSKDQTGVYARLSDGRVFLLDARPFVSLLPRPPLAAK